MTGHPFRTHRMDQAKTSARNLAALVRRYYDALREEGFGEHQALFLAESWQTAIIERQREAGPDA